MDQSVTFRKRVFTTESKKFSKSNSRLNCIIYKTSGVLLGHPVFTLILKVVQFLQCIEALSPARTTLHSLQRVEAEWKGDVQFGLEGRALQLLSQLQKPFVLDTFQAISVNSFNSGHTKMNTEGRRPLDVWVSKTCQFFPDF